MEDVEEMEEVTAGLAAANETGVHVAIVPILSEHQSTLRLDAVRLRASSVAHLTKRKHGLIPTSVHAIKCDGFGIRCIWRVPLSGLIN